MFTFINISGNNLTSKHAPGKLAGNTGIFRTTPTAELMTRAFGTHWPAEKEPLAFSVHFLCIRSTSHPYQGVVFFLVWNIGRWNFTYYPVDWRTSGGSCLWYSQIVVDYFLLVSCLFIVNINKLVIVLKYILIILEIFFIKASMIKFVILPSVKTPSNVHFKVFIQRAYDKVLIPV